MNTLTAPDCDFVCEPGRVINKAGVATPVPAGGNAVAMAVRAVESSTSAIKTVGVVGAHGSVGFNSSNFNQAKTASWLSGPLKNLVVGGLDETAQLDNSGISFGKGRVNNLWIQDLTFRATGTATSSAKACFSTDHHDTNYHETIYLERLWLTEGPNANAYWGLNLDASANYRISQIRGCHRTTGVKTVLKEHLVYCHNPFGDCWIKDCEAWEAGRTGIQVVTRDWKVSGAGYGTDKHADINDLLTISGNVLNDCSMWWDANAEGGTGEWFGNGSGLTIAGFPGNVLVEANVISQTHDGGGLFVCYHDHKVGAHKTPSGHAVGTLTMRRNTFNGEVDPDANPGARAQVSIGGCDDVNFYPQRIGGIQKELVINHATPNGAFRFIVKTPTEKPSQWPTWVGKDQAVYTYIDQNSTVPMTAAQIDALAVVGA